MNGELLLIFSFVIVMTTIVGLAVNGIVPKVLEYKRSQNANLPGNNAVDVANVLERTAHIEDRLKVLERIATDPEARRGSELAQEIEQLRLEQETEKS